MKGSNLLSAQQWQFLLLQAQQPGSPAYHLAAVFKIEGALDAPLLLKSCEQTLESHQILRTVYSLKGNGFSASVLDAQSTGSHVRSIRLGPGNDTPDVVVKRAIDTEVTRPFALESEPPLRALLIETRLDSFVFVLTLHHVAADMATLALVTDEIAHCYNTGTLKSKAPGAYQVYAVRQSEWLNGEQCRRMLDFWAGQLTGAPACT
jgi:NRPS condensation-like uncharacterized protein